MSIVAFAGAVELGLTYALVALGVYLSFRVLSFPDLTVDGSFPLGAAVAAALIVANVNPWLATLAGVLAGCVAGALTAWLNVRFNILHLLASILVMIALFSINIRIMGRPNVALLNETTVFTAFEALPLPPMWLRSIVLGVVVLVVVLLLARFLASDTGLAMRATGANAAMARAQGIDTGRQTLTGVALANGLTALAGALFAQANGFADVTTGLGTIVVGLAAVILGETLLPAPALRTALLACVLGSILYRIAVALALDLDALGLEASDLNLVTAVLVGIALLVPQWRAGLRRRLA